MSDFIIMEHESGRRQILPRNTPAYVYARTYAQGRSDAEWTFGVLELPEEQAYLFALRAGRAKFTINWDGDYPTRGAK